MDTDRLGEGGYKVLLHVKRSDDFDDSVIFTEHEGIGRIDEATGNTGGMQGVSHKPFVTAVKKRLKDGTFDKSLLYEYASNKTEYKILKKKVTGKTVTLWLE